VTKPSTPLHKENRAQNAGLSPQRLSSKVKPAMECSPLGKPASTLHKIEMVTSTSSAACKNHPDRHAEFSIRIDEESLAYCQRCAVLLASQGFKVARIKEEGLGASAYSSQAQGQGQPEPLLSRCSSRGSDRET
jgi:hypothetical protein